MIILDTNIISELMKPSPDKQLLSWLDKQSSDNLYVTSISIGEIMYGLHALPQSKHRSNLELAFTQVMSEAFADRSLPFNDAAAMLYGELMSMSREKGRVMSICDGQIAAITAIHQFQLATRNIKDFESCKIPLVNPFD